MPNSPSVKINLIGKPKLSFTDDFLKWGVNAGRIIIILTELIALAALGYRFYIDRKIIDLHDQIKREQLFIVGQASKEENYRSVMNRLDIVKITDENTKIKIGIMNQIVDLIKLGTFSSTNVSIDLANIRLEGVAFSIFPINTFIDDLKTNPKVSSISLDDISSTTQGIKFKMNIEVAEKKI